MKDTKIGLKEVNCLNRKKPPKKGETIYTDLQELKYNFNIIKELSIYLRKAAECPFGRGNWIADFTLHNGQMMCIKLPLSMSVEQVHDFFKPLIDDLEEYNNKETH